MTRSTIAFLAVLLTSGIGAGAAADPLPQLSGMVGTWTCSYTGPDGSRTVTATGKRLDADWLDLKGGSGGDSFVSYDAHRGSWVQFRTGVQGRAVMLIADAPPTATTLHWRMLYPQNRPAGTTTLQIPDASTRIVTSESVSGGKVFRTIATCKKR